MRIPLCLGLCLVLSAPLFAREEETFSVKAEIDKAFLTIGERVEYRVTVTHDPSIQILSKIVPPPSDAFEVKEVHDFFEKQGKAIVEGRRFVLVTYELGEFILDPVKVRYRTLQGKEKTAETNRLYLTVRSIDPTGKEKTDIRNAKGVLKLSRQWSWLIGFLVLLLVGGGGVWGWWRWSHRSLPGQEAQQPVLSPEEEAILRLHRLFDSDLIARGKLKEYFLEYSDILRRYFERRFEILAVESTTSEILRDLQQREISEGLQNKIQQALDTADLVKFAKWRPSPPEITRVNQLAKAIVEDARPSAPSPEKNLNPTNLHGL